MRTDEYGFSALEAIILVCLVIVIALVSYFVLSKQPTSLSSLLPSVATDLSTSYSNIVTNQDAWKAEDVISLPQKVSNYDYAVSSASAPTLAFGLDTVHIPAKSKSIKQHLFFTKTAYPATTENQAIAAVDSYLKDNGFKSQGTTSSSITFSITAQLDSPTVRSWDAVLPAASSPTNF